MKGRAPALVLSVALVAACSGQRPKPAGGTLTIEEIANPAALGSGEASLAALPDGRAVLSWIEPAEEDAHAVRLAVRESNRKWSAPRTVARGPGFFVNWADFPMVAALADGTLVAHWLERSGGSTYAYEVRLARSRDEGLTWSEALTPHSDRSAVEHGFVSMTDDGTGHMALVWLDGRDPQGTALLSARVGPEGPVSPEVPVDRRVCDCCQTALVRTPRGLLAAFRDRTEDEIRDIAVARFENGAWSEPQVVARDGWKIDGCPVNGPALAAEGNRIALAWFTLEPMPSVRLALSEDGGTTWAPAVSLHERRPLGRVDVAFLPGGDLVVSFLEQARAEVPNPEEEKVQAEGPGSARFLLRRVGREGQPGRLVEAAPTSSARSSGFPRLERAGDELLLAWRDTGEPARIRTALVRAASP